MARQTKQEKEIDKRIESTYYKYGSGVQVGIMDIPKIFQMGREAITNGEDLDKAIQDAIAKFRVN